MSKLKSKKNKGIYVVFEGLHGCGKSTQAQLLLNTLKKLYPKKKVLLTREPGGSEIADSIRKLVQGTKFKEHMSPFCDAYLYAASRAQTLRTIVTPVLSKGGIVVADRSYVSSMAIQGIVQGLSYRMVWKINREAVGSIQPDIVVVIDLDPKIIIERMHDKDGDKFENRQLGFYKKLAMAYRSLVKTYPKKLVLVDGSGTKEEVFERVIVEVRKKLIAY